MTRCSVLLTLALLSAPGIMAAQKTATAKKAVPQASGPTGFDSFLLLVPPAIPTPSRSAARRHRGRGPAETRRQQAETMRLGALSRIESKKVEIGRIKERTNAARKENREADRLGLEAERKAAELEIS